jgi:Bacteriophage tail sheath protein
VAQPTYPGVYVREVPSGVRTITGVATSITTFVGMAARGRIEVPTRVLSYSEFERTYSNDVTQGELPAQVRQFFLNGGTDAYIVRVAKDAIASSVTLRDALGSTDALTLTARDRGAIGNTIKARVSYDGSNPADLFNLSVYREVFDATGAPRQEEVETHLNLSMDSQSPRFVNGLVERDSNLVTAQAAAVTPHHGESASARLFADDSAIEDALLAAVTANPDNTGSFRIRVGRNPQVLVRITAAQTTLTTFNSFLSARLMAFVGADAQVSALSAAGPIRVFSTGSTDADVVIAPGDTRDDISRTLGLGLANGGVEVGTHSHGRPRENGISMPGVTTPISTTPTAIDPVGAMLELANESRPPNVAIDGAVLPMSAASLTFDGGGGSLSVIETLDDESLAALRQHLTTIAGTINANTSDWRASVQRNGIALRPTAGTAQSGLGHDLQLGASTETAGDVAAFSLWLSPVPGGTAQAGHAEGENGDPPDAATYDSAFLAIDREVDLFNILVLPRSAGATDEREAIWGAASAFCEGRRAFLIVDSPPSWTDRDAANAGVDSLRTGMVNDHAAVYWPPVTAADGTTIDPSGSMAGIMARTDARVGVWKAPAGLEATMRAVRGVSIPMSNRDNGVLNPRAINALRAFPNGIVSWGSRTLDGFDGSGNDDYKHVPLRRFALYLAESLDRGLRFAVFQGNDEKLWGQIRSAANSFMKGLHRQGAFAATRAADAYFVKCDSESTTPNDQNLGRVNVVVGFAPLKPAEFIIIHLQQMAGQSAV